MMIVRPPSGVISPIPLRRSVNHGYADAGTTLPVPMPSNLIAGQRLLLFVSSWGNSWNGSGATGFSLVNRAEGPNQGGVSAWTKVATGSESTLTLTGLMSGEPKVGVIISFDASNVHASSQVVAGPTSVALHSTPQLTVSSRAMGVFCVGQQATLIHSGSGPVTYSWDSTIVDNNKLTYSYKSATNFWQTIGLSYGGFTSNDPPYTMASQDATPSNPTQNYGYGGLTIALSL